MRGLRTSLGCPIISKSSSLIQSLHRDVSSHVLFLGYLLLNQVACNSHQYARANVCGDSQLVTIGFLQYLFVFYFGKAHTHWFRSHGLVRHVCSNNSVVVQCNTMYSYHLYQSGLSAMITGTNKTGMMVNQQRKQEITKMECDKQWNYVLTTTDLLVKLRTT